MAHVVVVGAGPAGATLAYLLARRGIRTTLIERHTDFAREFRGELLMPSGRDAFAQMGLAAQLDGVPQRAIGAVEFYRAARPLFRVDVAAQIGTLAPRIVSQPPMLEMLTQTAARFPAFRLDRGVTVRDLIEEDGRIVGLQTESRDGMRTLRADFIVGTDGRTSVLRRRAGLHEERHPQAFDVVWCKLPLPEFHATGNVARAYVGRGHLAIAFPAADDRLQVAWVINKGTFGELRQRGIDAWLSDMATHVAPDFATHLLAHKADVTQPFLLDVVCDQLIRWTAPGLLLLGDAAHPMSPVGGQGINIALRDALVAANHLVPALLGNASAGDLDAAARAVQAERQPEVTRIQTQQEGPPRVLFGDAWWTGFMLGGLLPLLVRTGIARRMFGGLFRRFAIGVTDVRLTV
jgi:2-polyprenyl-6-methoxyphenol hydroxylase-like FAD-dependent oxidoreductase